MYVANIMAVKVFYHVFCNAHTMSVVREQVIKLIFSGLYHAASCVYCCLAGDQAVIEQVQAFLSQSGRKFLVIKLGVGDTTYERFTLLAMPHYVAQDDKVFYFHSKGITRTTTDHIDHIRDWCTYMEYFLMGQHARCLALLDNHDTVGVSLRTEVALHYSGNFWWCRGDYFLTLDPTDLTKTFSGSSYLAPEMWVCSQNPRAASLFSSFTQHYAESFPTGEYVDQGMHTFPKKLHHST